MPMRFPIHTLSLVLLALAAIPQAHAGNGVWFVAEPTPGMPACEEFYDKWEIPGASSGILAMAGLGREVFAAKDCVDKGDVPMACKHWQGLLVVIDKMGPPLDENRGDIVALMNEHDCDADALAVEPDSKPSSDLPSKDAHSE